MIYHIIAFFLGFCLDLILGDPYYLPHTIRLIGNFISRLETVFLGNSKVRNEKKEKKQGVFLVVIVIVTVLLITSFILLGAYKLHVCLGIIVETIMSYQILATKCLKVESMKVYKYLKDRDIEGARQSVSMIVGRDTNVLDEEGIAKAAIETVAENTSDGVIAPMLYTALGGPILGFTYKAINTMDSMVGYKNEKYMFYGWCAAKLDDFVNFIPARISALFMIFAAFSSGKNFSGKRAWLMFKRDRYNHSSPNSAQTESACAGALGIRLAGDAIYFGKIVKKPYIGDAVRKVEIEDIKKVNHLMYVTAWLSEIVMILLLVGCYIIVN